MGKNKIKLNFSLTLALIVFCLGFFVDSAQAADIEASVSRTTGVAPLSVHFNADLAASSETERSFHDLEYAWNFGDINAGNWGTNGNPKNEDKGPVAAHVYEAPGTFMATLTVRDTTGIVDTKTFEITVEDPDVVFAGTDTACISTTTDFSDCPFGANQITTTELTIISNYISVGKRVLLRRGSSWSLNTDIAFLGNTGPVHIGAFGSCSDPDLLGICSNAPSIAITGGSRFLSLSDKRDWRLTDISFSAAKGISAVIGGATGIKNNLVLKIKSSGFNGAILTSNYRDNDTDFNDNNAFVSSRLTDSTSMTVYTGSERLAILGNVIQNSDETHVLRVFQSYQGVINHNLISGASVANLAGRQALKLHGPSPIDGPGTGSKVGTIAETGTNGLRNYSQYIVVSNNVFGASGPWPVEIGPQNAVHDERLSDVIFEKNKVVADYGQNSERLVTTSALFQGRYMTVRNNIVDGTGSANDGYVGIVVNRRGVEWAPLGNRIYNNTIYNSENLSYCRAIDIGEDANDTIVTNNYVSIPNTSGEKLLIRGNAVANNNVLTDVPYFIDPDNANPLLRNFSLTASATEAIDQGITVPVFDDFTGQSRAGVYDIGAFEYAETTSFRADVDGSSGITTTDALLTLRNSLGLSMTGTAWQPSATTGDVNCDGVSNSTDALLILRHSLGLSMSGTPWCG